MQLRLTLALLLTALFLSGCGGGSSEEAPKKTPPTETPDLTWDDSTKTWDNTKWK